MVEARGDLWMSYIDYTVAARSTSQHYRPIVSVAAVIPNRKFDDAFSIANMHTESL